jgi:soluble lytic murein transglycosylase-like protein
LLWGFLLGFFLLPLQTYSSKYTFKYDRVLREDVFRVYLDSSKFGYRKAQVYCESGFNPRATSDYGGWRKAHMDTISAILQNKGAAGLSQFIWATASRYGATSVNPDQANCDCHGSNDIYNPYWSLDAMCRYMKAIDLYLLSTCKNRDAKRKLMTDVEFSELVACASYNTGEGRLKNRLNKYSKWDQIAPTILPEPVKYAEKIQRLSKEMTQ